MLRVELLAMVGVCHHSDAWLLSAGAGANAHFSLIQLRNLRISMELLSKAVPTAHEDTFRGLHCCGCEEHANWALCMQEIWEEPFAAA